jgi:E3 ubiquitin-protein ligase MYLIP
LQVCESLNIICEQDYFGLIYVRDEKENATVEEISGCQWINLRNPLGKHGHIVANTVMLAMRVKFWVPAHLILQESVRNVFYSQARQELLEGHLRATNWSNASKLAALLMQGDGIKCSANGKIVQHECLPIVTRKRKCSENEGRRASVNQNEPTTSSASAANIYSEYIIRPSDDFEDPMPENFLDMIAKEHEKLAKYKPSSAKYWLLEEIQSLEGYGEEVFEGTVHSESTYKYKLGVNPHGIAVYKEDKEKYW